MTIKYNQVRECSVTEKLKRRESLLKKEAFSDRDELRTLSRKINIHGEAARTRKIFPLIISDYI
jgi:hypothetical protein